MQSKVIADMFLHALAQLSESERTQAWTHVFSSLAKNPLSKMGISERKTKPDLSRENIEKTIEACGKNLSETARQLGCARRTLQNRMRKYGMPPGMPGVRGK